MAVVDRIPVESVSGSVAGGSSALLLWFTGAHLVNDFNALMLPATLVHAYPSDRGRTMGVHGWGGSVGAFIAPLGVAVLVTALGWRSGLFVLVLPSLIVALLLHRGVTESEPKSEARLRGGIGRDVWLLAVTFALLSMVIRGFLTFLPTFLVEGGSSLSEAGLLTTFILVVGLIAQPFGGVMFDRFGGRRVFFVASVGTTASLLFFALSAGWLVLVAMAAVAFFVFSMFPVSLAMGSELSGVERTGIGVGIIFGVSGLSGAVVQPLIGAVADRTSLHAGLSLLIVVAALAAVLSLSLPAGRPHSNRS